LIAASLSQKKSIIENPSRNEDIEATIAAIEAYGTDLSSEERTLIVVGSGHIDTPEDVVYCSESASTMRFVTPILAHASGISVVTGGPSLRKRPMHLTIDCLGQLGVKCYSVRNNGCAPLVTFGGTYKGGNARVVGNVTSQVISGLLFSAILASQATSIEITTVLESAPYVKMTLQVLRDHGIEVTAGSDLRRLLIKGGQSVDSATHIIEGDYSSAAFLLVAGAITGSEIHVSGLKTRASIQGDSEIVNILRAMNAEIQTNDDSVWIHPSRLHATNVDAANCPDLVPPIAAAACYAEGTTKITNAQRLRSKESNRLAALSMELRKMGAKIQETEEGLTITGSSILKGSRVASYGDHRVAMACSVAALGAKGRTIISEAGCVAKSYPRFFDDLKTLGGDVLGWK
jgi:3-phosphoshikimate 1-carboxyvinyltransferase